MKQKYFKCQRYVYTNYAITYLYMFISCADPISSTEYTYFSVTHREWKKGLRMPKSTLLKLSHQGMSIYLFCKHNLLKRTHF